MPVNSRRPVPLGVKMFTALWLFLSQAPILATPATNQGMLTTAQAMELAEQQFDGRVIKLLNGAAIDSNGFYSLQLINRRGKILTLYIDRLNGTVSELKPAASILPPSTPAGSESVARP